MSNSNENIPNWSIYGAGRVTLAIFDCPEEDGEPVFQGALMLQLDDGEGDELTTNPEEAKCVTIMTDIVQASKNGVMRDLVDAASMMFDEINQSVLHFDLSAKVIGAILVEDILSDRLDDE